MFAALIIYMVFIPLVKLAEMASDGDQWASAHLFRSVDLVISLARAFDYVWPLRYHPFLSPVKEGTGRERSDIYTHLHLMMKCHELSGNATFLHEALSGVRARHPGGPGRAHASAAASFIRTAVLRVGGAGTDDARQSGPERHIRTGGSPTDCVHAAINRHVRGRL